MYKKLISLLLCGLLIIGAAMPIWAEETVEETALRKMVITSEEEFLELAAIVPEDMVVICTGRQVPERVKECADELYQVTLEK